MSTGKTRNKWDKKNLRNIVGCRVREVGVFYNANTVGVIVVKPTDFLVSKSRLLPFTIYGTDIKVHVPRSLCTRARIVVNINKGNKIIANQPNQSALNRPPKV